MMAERQMMDAGGMPAMQYPTQKPNGYPVSANLMTTFNGGQLATCSGWVWKRKSEGSTSRFLNQFNKRFFMVDFNKEQFFYSSSPDMKKVSMPFTFNDLLSTYAVSAPEAGRSISNALWGRGSGPSTEHGICVQTRQKEFELYFANASDCQRWLQAFERAILTAKISQENQARNAMKIPPPELNRAVSASSAVETFDTASTAATSGKATPTEALDEGVQVIEASHQIPPAPAHSTQPCLATSLETAEAITAVEASGGLEPPKAWTPSPTKTGASPKAKNYTDHAAGMTVHDRLQALEFSDYGSDSDLGDLAAADQILGELDAAATGPAEEVQSAAVPSAEDTSNALAQADAPAESVTLIRENSWDAPSPKVELIREHSWDD
jgi:hypothetical protein